MMYPLLGLAWNCLPENWWCGNRFRFESTQPTCFFRSEVVGMHLIFLSRPIIVCTWWLPLNHLAIPIIRNLKSSPWCTRLVVGTCKPQISKFFTTVIYLSVTHRTPISNDHSPLNALAFSKHNNICSVNTKSLFVLIKLRTVFAIQILNLTKE